MKRSEINALIDEAIAFTKGGGLILPPFAYWSKADWADKGEEYNEIRDNMLGWDITDFGSGDFLKIGLLLFTVRNGNDSDPRYPKTYCEKVMISKVNQVTPFHYHYNKTEDIINRGGGILAMQLYNSTPDGALADTDVLVSRDGRNYYVKAGTILRLEAGESVTFYPGIYHSFWAEEGTTLVVEVSKVNDDRVDNHFLSSPGRFPKIEEDVEPTHLLAMDYSNISADC